jgi:hypothetical protein
MTLWYTPTFQGRRYRVLRRSTLAAFDTGRILCDQKDAFPNNYLSNSVTHSKDIAVVCMESPAPAGIVIYLWCD